MSERSDTFEAEVVLLVNNHRGETLPLDIPEWLKNEGVVPGAKILGAEGIGSLDHKNKTDVVIHLEDSEPIKISAKLRNAHFFGNWYGHKRFLEEFGIDKFEKMTEAATNFANKWSKTTERPFVGVSICFGKRVGNTALKFTEVFSPEDILTIARGSSNSGNPDSVANCMYVADGCADSIPGLIDSIEPLTVDSVNRATEDFKIAFRPVNPMTEGSNRGKNVYSRFVPSAPLPHKTVFTNPRALFELGCFEKVKPNRLNHNKILNDLEHNYNIVIPKKEKLKKK